MEKIEIEVTIAARAATVYKFLSDARKFRQWIGDADISAVAGGELAVRYPNGDVARGRFLELVPNRRVVFTWGYEDAANGMPPGSTTVTVELHETAAGTLLRLFHDGIPGIPARDAHQRGWEHHASRIASLACAEHLELALGPAIENYFKAWTEPDALKRLAALEACWDENGAFCDSMGSVVGRAALSNYIGAALQYAPAAKLESAGPHQQTREYVRFDWRIVSGGQIFGAGTNFGKLNGNGQFESVVGFWNPASS